jgi:hypothetical protein
VGRDCGIICSPGTNAHDPEHVLAYRIAAQVAARSGVGHLAYLGNLPSPSVAWHLDISARLPAKQAGIRAHKTAYSAPSAGERRLHGAVQPFERFIEITAPIEHIR